MQKRLFGKLVLACEDEIFNTTKTSINIKKYHKIMALFILFLWQLYYYYHYLSFLLIVITIIQKFG